MLKFIDLFSGIGGFHIAFHDLGCECVFASEIDQFARKTYKHNFYKIAPNLFDEGNFNEDIRCISAGEIPDFDILCAGFPCQPFSQAGYRQGFNDVRNSERGNLFFNIAEIIDIKRPKAFFLENVRGLISHNNGNTFSIIRNILEEEFKYSFYHKIVYASDYGLPQLRPRAFIIGFRDEGFFKGFNFPQKLPLSFDMSDVFGGNCSRKIGFTLRVGGAGSNINDRRNWDSYLVDNKVVRLNPNQGLKMQGFPEGFEFPVSKKEAMKQLGNSVAIDAVRECARAILIHLETLDFKNKGKNMVETKNKGEWTELYAFLKIVKDQKLFLSDARLNIKSPNSFMKVNAVSTLNIKEKILLLSENQIAICSDSLEPFEIKEMPSELSHEFISKVARKIREGSGTFTVDEFKILRDSFGITIVKGGNSSQKSDIVLDIEHENTCFLDQGFGIKSYLGSNPTLLNASGNTNFVFKVTGIDDSDIPKINSINTATKMKDRIKYIYDKNGGALEFQKMEAATMEHNLKLVDSLLPQIAAKLLLNFYLNRFSSLRENINYFVEKNDEGKDGFYDIDSIIVKIKRMLVSILLGFFAGTKWDGKYLSKGTIVVKQDGTQVVFHVAEIDDLEDFLIENIKFDTPSTTRHRFGTVFKERDGQYYFKLNMQLRF